MKILPVAKEMFLDYYYLKSLSQLTENFAGMFIGWSFRKLMGFCVDILDAGHSRKYNHLIGVFFHFLCGSEIQVGWLHTQDIVQLWEKQ